MLHERGGGGGGGAFRLLDFENYFPSAWMICICLVISLDCVLLFLYIFIVLQNGGIFDYIHF